MGHYICTEPFHTSISTKRIQKTCDEVAIREGDYHKELIAPIRFVNKVLPNRETAEKWIEAHDKGWYDQLAVKYKEGRKIYWLVKYEFHC